MAKSSSAALQDAGQASQLRFNVPRALCCLHFLSSGPQPSITVLSDLELKNRKGGR